MRRTYTFVEPVGDAVINVLVAIIVGDLYWRGERIPLKIEIIIIHKRLHHIKQHCKHLWMYRPRDQRDSVQMDQSTSHKMPQNMPKYSRIFKSQMSQIETFLQLNA